MGKKKSGTSKKHSSVKTKIAKKRRQSLYESPEYLALPLPDRDLFKHMQDVEAQLQGRSINSVTREILTVSLKEIKNAQKQSALAVKLVKNPLNYSLVADPVSSDERMKLEMMVFQAAKKVPRSLTILLLNKLMDKFGATYEHFVRYLLNNIRLQAMVKVTQDDLGLSDDQMWKMKPISKLLLMSAKFFTEEELLKAIVHKFELAVSSSLPAEDIITKLVEKMALAFAEVAPAEVVKKMALTEVAPGEDVKILEMAEVVPGEDVKKKALAEVAPSADVKILAMAEVAPGEDVKKMALAFAEIAPAEDAVAIGVHGISLAE